MRKLVVLTAVLLVSAIGVTACSVPNIGKMEIINAVKGAAEEAQEPATQDAAAAQDAQDPNAGGAAASDEGQDPAVEENVPEVAAQNEKEAGGKEEKEGKDDPKKYAERIECKTAVIGGNNMIVQVKNNNDMPIPTLTVHVNYQDGKKSYDFYQVPSGGQIVIPVEKGEGDLPPAVSADVSVCMDENEYTGLSSLLNVEQSKTNSAYKLTVTNTADIACRKMSIAVLFSNETGVICVLTTSAPEPLAPGASTTFTFTLPQSFTDAGVSFTNAAYVMNEAVG